MKSSILSKLNKKTEEMEDERTFSVPRKILEHFSLEVKVGSEASCHDLHFHEAELWVAQELIGHGKK